MVSDDDDEGSTVLAPALGVETPLPFARSAPLPAAPAPAAPSAPARPATWAGTMSRELGLSLGELALLAAELSVTRAAADVHARYGLDAMTYVAETAAWERRFAADPKLLVQYTAAYQRCRARLAGG